MYTKYRFVCRYKYKYFLFFTWIIKYACTLVNRNTKKWKHMNSIELLLARVIFFFYTVLKMFIHTHRGKTKVYFLCICVDFLLYIHHILQEENQFQKQKHYIVTSDRLIIRLTAETHKQRCICKLLMYTAVPRNTH